ncbi:MAG: MBL fold metallo-hydrolase [Pseudomonadota bacterium]
MRPSFHPRLINDPFLDPGLFIPFLFEKRALMFDLGQLRPLSSRDLLKLTHVFVTHTHMDHFIGFDALLRIFIGREKELHIFGPPYFFKHVEGKLAGYNWNLVNEYQNDFQLKVTEVHEDKMLTRTYLCHDGFKPKRKKLRKSFAGILLKEPHFHVEATLLDHRIPCMGLSLKENFYVNIIKEGLRELCLPVGAWLNRFKQALYEQKDLGSDFLVTWEERGKVVKEKKFVLGELAEKVAAVSPGQKITYITDIIGSPENYEKVLKLAHKADHLFIEAAFLDRDKETAKKKYHLTAKEAGELAKRAGVNQFTPFHFSPRYCANSKEIKREAMEAFRN